MKVPKPKYLAGDQVRSIFISRDAYERILRRLVLSFSNRIRWVTGTATSVLVAPKNPNVLESVTVRKPDNSEEVIPTTLVIGTCRVEETQFR